MLSLFFFNDTATTEIYTLSLHDALPISVLRRDRITITTTAAITSPIPNPITNFIVRLPGQGGPWLPVRRSEEHTSELQSRQYLVCSLLLEKKKKIMYTTVLYIYIASFHL